MSSPAQAIADNWPLVLGLSALIAGAGALVGFVFKLFFWSESRVERIATKLLTSEVVKRFMIEVSTQVFTQLSQRDHEMRASLAQKVDDLTKRDEERLSSVKSAHLRIDDMQKQLFHLLGGRGLGGGA